MPAHLIGTAIAQIIISCDTKRNTTVLRATLAKVCNIMLVEGQKYQVEVFESKTSLRFLKRRVNIEWYLFAHA